MAISHFFKTVFLLQFLLFSLAAIASEDDEPCASFKDAEIDQAIMARMLEAAEDGYLYRIKPKSSKMGFCVESSIGMVSAEFQAFRGGMALDKDDGQTMVSINADSLKSSGAFIDSILKSKSFFDVDTYEKITFVSTGFEWIGKKHAVLKGDLSMRGVTRPVAFYVEISPLSETDRIKVKATTTVQRSAFGLSSLEPLVSDKVNLCMSVEAEKYRSWAL